MVLLTEEEVDRRMRKASREVLEYMELRCNQDGCEIDWLIRRCKWCRKRVGS